MDNIIRTEITERYETIPLKDYWTIVIVCMGDGNYQFHAQIQEYNYGDCFIIAPGEMLVLVPEYNTSCYIAALTLSMEDILYYYMDSSAQSLLKHLFSTDHPLVKFNLEQEAMAIIQNYICLLYDIKDSRLPYSMLIYRYIISAFGLYVARAYYLFEPQKKPVSRKLSAKLSIVEGAKHYINLNYSEDLSLSKISDHVFTNPSYLSRIFKETTGMELFAYLNQVRISKAKQLLTDTDDLIIDIAVACGFNNVSHFNKIFKKIENLSPTQYRKKNKPKPRYL